MKAREIPTSPKHASQAKEIDELYKMEPTILQPASHIGGIVVWTALIAILATLGAFIGLRTLADRYPSTPILSSFKSAAVTTERVVIQQPNAPQNVSIGDIVSKVSPSLTALVKNSNDSVRQLNDRIGNAVFISSDGGIITTTSSATLGTTSLARMVNGVEQRLGSVATDSATGIVFAKNGVSTTPATFSDSDQAAVGDQVVIVRLNAYAGGIEYAPSAIMGIRERSSAAAGTESLVESSETIDRFIRLSDSFDSSWYGAGVFDLKSHLVGIVYATDTSRGTYVLPINAVRRLVTQYVTTGTVPRASLGIRYVDLSYNSAIDSLPSKGDYVYSNDKKIPAVIAKSAAATAGILPGDVITALDTAPINELRSVSDAIGTYAPGDKISVTVQRNGKEVKLSVTLGTQATK